MAYSPFGFLVTRKRDMVPPPRYDDPILRDIAEKYGKTTGQIVLRYLVSTFAFGHRWKAIILK